MAKLGSYYGLCPLIDHRSLLGISEDAEEGIVIVTLGKNIAIKYQLSDQKQLHSWRTKDNFSSPIIFDKNEEKYFAVFNQTYIKSWIGNEENIDGLKKYKFDKIIHTIISFEKKSFIIFKNGSVFLLNDALKNRKNLILTDIINDETEYIADITCTTVKDDIYLGLIVKFEENYYFTWFILENDSINYQHSKIELNRPDATLTGYVCHHDIWHDVKLITIWSDGKVYFYTLNKIVEALEPPGEFYSIIESLSCKEQVTVSSLSNDYIAIYGAALNEEGATLIIYNLQFRVVQSKLLLKMFSVGAKIWQIENNLLFCVGQNLAVVPFSLATEQLAALVSSHKVTQNDISSDVQIIQNLQVANWDDKPITKNIDKIPRKIKKFVLQFTEQGWPENIICETLIPQFIEKNDINSVINCLEYFIDISEYCLSMLLKFCLTVDGKIFTNNESIHLDSTLQPPARCDLMNKILSKSFSDVLLLPYLKSELDINSVIVILEYILYMLTKEYVLPSLSIIPSEIHLIEWCCVLLDCNYQKILLMKDANVNKIFSDMISLVDEHLSYLDDLKQITPFLGEFKRGKSSNKSKPISSLKYSVEELKLC